MWAFLPVQSLPSPGPVWKWGLRTMGVGLLRVESHQRCSIAGSLLSRTLASLCLFSHLETGDNSISRGVTVKLCMWSNYRTAWHARKRPITHLLLSQGQIFLHPSLHWTVNPRSSKKLKRKYYLCKTPLNNCLQPIDKTFPGEKSSYSLERVPFPVPFCKYNSSWTKSK